MTSPFTTDTSTQGLWHQISIFDVLTIVTIKNYDVTIDGPTKPVERNPEVVGHIEESRRISVPWDIIGKWGSARCPNKKRKRGFSKQQENYRKAIDIDNQADSWCGHISFKFHGENSIISQRTGFRVVSDRDNWRRNTNSNTIPQDAIKTILHLRLTTCPSHCTTARWLMAGPKVVAVFQLAITHIFITLLIKILSETTENVESWKRRRRRISFHGYPICERQRSASRKKPGNEWQWSSQRFPLSKQWQHPTDWHLNWCLRESVCSAHYRNSEG